MQSKSVEWDNTAANFRRSSKRASILGAPPAGPRLPPPIPSHISGLRLEETEEVETIDIISAAASRGAADDDDDGPTVTVSPMMSERKDYSAMPPTMVDDIDDGGSDEDDEEDDEIVGGDGTGAWRLFVSPTDPATKLYYNTATREVSYGAAPEGALSPSTTTQKRNSSILSDTWTNDGEREFSRKSGRVPPPIPGTAAGDKARSKTSRDRLYERIQDSLQEAARHIDVLSSSDGPGAAAGTAGATPQVTELLAAVRRNLAATVASMDMLQRSVVKDTAPLDFLLGTKKLRWDFGSSVVGSDASGAGAGAGASKTGGREPSKSISSAAALGSVSAIEYYRAASQQTDHASLAFTDYHFPQYYSAQALPPDSTHKASCIVRLPAYAPMTQTKIEVDAADTVTQVIAKAHAKLPKTHPEVLDAGEYVFKVVGHQEYLAGDDIFFSYAHVRHCLRDKQDIELALVRRPEKPPGSDSVAQAAHAAAVAGYTAKIDRSVRVMTADTHVDIAAAARDPMADLTKLRAFPLSSLNTPFSMRVLGVDNVNSETMPRLTPTIGSIYVRACLFHGCEYLDWSHELPALDVADTMRWDAHLPGSFQSQFSLLPREARLGFVVIGKRSDKDKEVPLAWVTSVLVDHTGTLKTGRVEFRLWAFPAAEGKKHGKKRDLDPDFLFRATTVDNRSSGSPAALLVVDLPRFALPVVAPLALPYAAPNPRVVGAPADVRRRLDKDQSRSLLDAIVADPLFRLTSETKKLLWTHRHSLVDDPSALSKVLQCVSTSWGQADFRNEAFRLLMSWKAPADPARALELLDARYADYSVRKWAVDQLRRLTDDELQLYLLQLTQCLKFEPYHDSPLSRFLLERALKSPYQVGHSFFWHLKAEVHDPLVCERFALILEEFLCHAGYYVDELYKQAATVLKLQRIAEMIVHLKREMQYSDADAMREYRKEIEALNTNFFKPMGKFQVPLNPKWEATGLIVDKCRFMSSKMVPLFLVFRNADEDAPPIYVIFKSGDDLRQDLLTLQLLRVMDQMWLANKLDMRLKPYRVLATGVNDNGDGVGMIEVVLNSDTTSGIQHKHGGGAMGALKLDPIDLFIREHNVDKGTFLTAVDNFIRSCAGYCVATYVMGIGDRHNGNIMVTKSGHLFHIDFGHFLGNFKKKFGVNRERAAFVFTPEMAFVIGGKNYRKSAVYADFLKLCSNAFKVLRANATMLETLFMLMVAAGMPELMRENDIHYLRNKLSLEMTNSVAVKELESEIDKSLNSTYRRIDNYIHILVHNG